MIIDTQKSTIGIQLRKLVFLMLLVLFLVLLYTTPFWEKPVWGIERNDYAVAATIIYIIYYLISFLRDINYFYFNNNSSKIIMRYYSLRPLSSDQNSLEVNKEEYYKYEIKKTFGGFRKYLIIYQRTAKGIAKYPPISISILKKKDVEQLTRELSNVR
ncbi:MAG TPA: hypothetical protein VHO90_08300 [Bacteroidales bacterium]|nr:hypothetical protein [Bacteroidales bacterium]